MEFLTVLITLALLQLWGSGGPVQRDEWFNTFCENIAAITGSSTIRLLILVLSPMLLVLLVQALLDNTLLGLPSLILFVIVLLYGLGRGDFSDQLQHYLSAWNHGNFESAYDKALAMGDFQQSDAIADHQSLHDHVRRAFIYTGFERWFAVVFWFLLLGPVGAVGYRLMFLAARSTSLAEADQQLALRVVHYLDWLPARLLVISFALTGNFVDGFNRCWQLFFENPPCEELLDDTALAAIDHRGNDRPQLDNIEAFIEYGRQELLALQGLLSRSVVCWVIVIAVLTLVAS